MEMEFRDRTNTFYNKKIHEMKQGEKKTQILSKNNTLCPRIHVPFYKVTYYIKQVKTSLTYNTNTKNTKTAI